MIATLLSSRPALLLRPYRWASPRDPRVSPLRGDDPDVQCFFANRPAWISRQIAGRRAGLRHRRKRLAAPRTALVRWSAYKDLDTASGDTGRLRHSWRHTGLHDSAGEEVRCRSAFVVSAATRSEVDQSHYYSVPDGPSPAPREDLEQGIVNVPTPGPRDLVRPATSEGTLNEATPEAQYRLLLARRGLPYGTLINPVRSYLTKDQWGNLIVVNVTQPGHELHPGYVARYVTSSDKGSTIQNEGEGLGGLQGPLAERLGIADWINGVWRGQANEIMRGNK